MTNLPGYERIGSWDISLAVPEDARKAIATYFQQLRDKHVPRQIIFSDSMFFHNARNLLVWAEKSQRGLEALIETTRSRLIPGGNSSYLDHYVMSSTQGFVENPFVPIGNLYHGYDFKVRDYKANPPQNYAMPEKTVNPAKMKARIVWFSNGEAWYHTFSEERVSEMIKLGLLPEDVKVKGEYEFLAVMDWEKIEARIEPGK